MGREGEGKRDANSEREGTKRREREGEREKTNERDGRAVVKRARMERGGRRIGKRKSESERKSCAFAQRRRNVKTSETNARG